MAMTQNNTRVYMQGTQGVAASRPTACRSACHTARPFPPPSPTKPDVISLCPRPFTGPRSGPAHVAASARPHSKSGYAGLHQTAAARFTRAPGASSAPRRDLMVRTPDARCSNRAGPPTAGPGCCGNLVQLAGVAHLLVAIPSLTLVVESCRVHHVLRHQRRLQHCAPHACSRWQALVGIAMPVDTAMPPPARRDTSTHSLWTTAQQQTHQDRTVTSFPLG